MKNIAIAIRAIREMRNSGLSNYVIPGLSSYLLGGQGFGCVHMFECSREHQENITPHSHRFDFQALVLQGSVENIVWRRNPNSGDEFQMTRLRYGGEPGKYVAVGEPEIGRWVARPTIYGVGDWYGMPADEIHSIKFSSDAIVLFFESPTRASESVILEPHVDGQTVHTFKTEPWMFQAI